MQVLVWEVCVLLLWGDRKHFIIDGKHLKSMNQWYNKRIATIKENKTPGFWNEKLAHITEKRNRQARDAVNKAARLVINHCLTNNIGTIVFGWNKQQKDHTDMGKLNNQKFVQIPSAKLKGSSVLVMLN